MYGCHSNCQAQLWGCFTPSSGTEQLGGDGGKALCCALRSHRGQKGLGKEDAASLASPLWGLGVLSPSLGSSGALPPAQTPEMLSKGMGTAWTFSNHGADSHHEPRGLHVPPCTHLLGRNQHPALRSPRSLHWGPCPSCRRALLCPWPNLGAHSH